jgi:hypothetical protein
VLAVAVREWRTELTSELIEEFVALAPSLARKEHIALALSVPATLFKWWVREGKRADAPPLMRELSARYNAARAQRIVSVSGAAAMNALINPDMAESVLRRVEGPDPEPDDDAPEQSLESRKDQMREALRDPSPELVQVLEQALEGDSPLRALLIELTGKR